jgi:uncharacterized protein YkwD
MMIARTTFLITATALLLGFVASVGTPRAQTPPATRLIDYVNAARIQNGLTALPEHVRLSLAAITHARDMAENGFVGHDGSDGSNVGERVSRAGYAWTTVAENAAAGQPTVQEVIRDWMKSPGHRENILNEDIREIGAGHISVPNFGTGQNYTHYWVVVFARR